MALMFSFSYVKETKKIAIFLVFGLVFIIFSILYAKKNDLGGLSESIKFILCFLNITSLVYFLEKISKTSYFDMLNSSLYQPLYAKGVNTDIFLLAIFVATSILLLSFNRLSLGEDYGKERK